MTVYRCVSASCTFEALIPNAPDGADALKCPVCGEPAVAELDGRPAFRCERCRSVFRAYSTRWGGRSRTLPALQAVAGALQPIRTTGGDRRARRAFLGVFSG